MPSYAPTREQIEAELKRQRERRPPIVQSRGSLVPPKSIPKKALQMLHIWKLEDSCYFIGQSESGPGEQWISRHPVVGLVDSVSCADKNDIEIEQHANKLTLQYMQRFGWRSVRGGSLCQSDDLLLEKRLRKEGIFDKLDAYYENKQVEVAVHQIRVYVLELEGGNFYVGQTKNFKRRANQHALASGALWTKVHPPIRVVEFDSLTYRTDSAAAKRETDLTLQYMKEYGWDKVRGGAFCYPDKMLHLRQLHSSGHFREIPLAESPIS